MGFDPLPLPTDMTAHPFGIPPSMDNMLLTEAHMTANPVGAPPNYDHDLSNEYWPNRISFDKLAAFFNTSGWPEGSYESWPEMPNGDSVWHYISFDTMYLDIDTLEVDAFESVGPTYLADRPDSSGAMVGQANQPYVAFPFEVDNLYAPTIEDAYVPGLNLKQGWNGSDGIGGSIAEVIRGFVYSGPSPISLPDFAAMYPGVSQIRSDALSAYLWNGIWIGSLITLYNWQDPLFPTWYEPFDHWSVGYMLKMDNDLDEAPYLSIKQSGDQWQRINTVVMEAA